MCALCCVCICSLFYSMLVSYFVVSFVHLLFCSCGVVLRRCCAPLIHCPCCSSLCLLHLAVLRSLALLLMWCRAAALLCAAYSLPLLVKSLPASSRCPSFACSSAHVVSCCGAAVRRLIIVLVVQVFACFISLSFVRLFFCTCCVVLPLSLVVHNVPANE